MLSMKSRKQGGESVELSRDINVITAEINSYKQIAGQAIFEIGRRLKHVRESIFTEKGHLSGKWSEWCKEINMNVTTAKRFIQVYEKLGDNRDTWHGLSMRVLYEIATLPHEQREQPHIIPSTGETKTVDEMTVRELREVKKALKAEQEARKLAEQKQELAESEAATLRDTLESMEATKTKPEVVTEYVYIEKEPENKVRIIDAGKRKQFSKLVPILGGFLGMYSEWRK